MALPPTAFKDLLRGTNEEVYDTLARERCLSWKGRRDRGAVIALMRESARKYADWTREHPRCTGPNARDQLADALLDSPFVNRKARRLAQKDSR